MSDTEKKEYQDTYIHQADIAKFLRLVAEMRKAQRAYFDKKTRNQQTLISAKNLEAAVDSKLSEMGIR